MSDGFPNFYSEQWPTTYYDTVRVSYGSIEEMVANDMGLSRACKDWQYMNAGMSEYAIESKTQMNEFLDEVDRRESAWLNGEEDF
jgi:hypothetical protein